MLHAAAISTKKANEAAEGKLFFETLINLSDSHVKVADKPAKKVTKKEATKAVATKKVATAKKTVAPKAKKVTAPKLTDITGIGPKTMSILATADIQTIAQLGNSTKAIVDGILEGKGKISVSPPVCRPGVVFGIEVAR